MTGLTEVRAGMEVYGSCGERVGLAERVEGGRLLLSPDGPLARGRRRELPLDWVESADGCVRLGRTCEQVWRRWQGD